MKNKPLKPTKNLDTVAATDDGLAEVEEAIFLQQALSLLTSRQQKVIRATVREGRTEQEVAKYAVAFYVNDTLQRRVYLELGNQKVRCKYVNDTYEDSDTGGAGEVKYNWMRWTGMSLKTGTGKTWSLWTTSYNSITESGTFTNPPANDPKYTIKWISQWHEKRIKHNY